jgi:hypothetical protein
MVPFRYIYYGCCHVEITYLFGTFEHLDKPFPGVPGVHPGSRDNINGSNKNAVVAFLFDPFLMMSLKHPPTWAVPAIVQ